MTVKTQVHYSMEDPLGLPPKPMSCTELQKLIGDNPVEMEPRQFAGRFSILRNNAYYMAMAAAYPQKDKTVVKQLYTFNTCRETASCPISIGDARSTPSVETTINQHFVENKDAETQNYWTRKTDMKAHVGMDMPTVVLFRNAKLSNVKSVLKVIHHYERLARAGRTKVYPVSHNFYTAQSSYYSTGPFTVKPEETSVVMVVGPSFWHFSIPMMSMYLLLLRAGAHVAVSSSQGPLAYLEWASNNKVLRNKDSDWLKKVYQVDFDGTTLDMISVFCRRWRLLQRAKAPYKQEYQGFHGSATIVSGISKYLRTKQMSIYTDKKAALTAAGQLEVSHRGMFLELLKQLKREKRRVARTGRS